MIAPARTKDGLIAAIYLAVDGPDYAALNYDALADVLADLGWLPPGPVHLAWVGDAHLPPGVQRSVMQILVDAAAESVGGRHPLSVYQLDQPTDAPPNRRRGPT
ncbi:MAG: barstar family protein [bacterium]